LIDGTRLIVGSGTVSFPVAIWPYESVEVLRGPASVLFGDGAIGGAVNYLTRQPLRDRQVNEAFLSAGSYDTVRSGVASRGPITDSTAYAIQLYSETSNGYIDRTGYNLSGYSGSLLFDPLSGLTVQISADGSVNNGATYRGTPVNDSRLDPTLRRTNFNVADADLRFEDHWLRVKTTYEVSPSLSLRHELYRLTSKRHFRDVQNYAYVLPAAQQIQRTRYMNIFHDQTQIGSRLDTTTTTTVAGMANKTVVGIDHYRTDFDHINNSENDGSTYAGSSLVPLVGFNPGPWVNSRATVLRGQNQLSTTALFIENALDLSPHWKLVAGLRRDEMKLSATDVRLQRRFDTRYTPVTGRLGAVWSPLANTSFYGQFATATDPANGLLVSVPSVRETELAKAQQIELGAKGQMPAIKGEWTVAAYRIEKTNLLATDPATGQRQQIGKQSSQGLELALTLQPLPGWTVDANVALLSARFDKFFESVGANTVSRTGNRPTNVPQRLANLWLGYGLAPGWNAAVGAQYVGERFGNNANTTRAPSYTLLDAALSYKASPNLRLDLALRNLTDRIYGGLVANNGAQWILGAPRTVELTARTTF